MTDRQGEADSVASSVRLALRAVLRAFRLTKAIPGFDSRANFVWAVLLPALVVCGF
ncbi:hypothetical protein sS8_4465 [Methylocaldum marinum]|uniref:Uncharacterized protein n=1 Tax=Methylocaldum marinum TaxID=1432792 RepID=A0A250KXP6_9GAMM|nr:hypothetical protein sS8_4465 [Methylocaldum marinum]